MDYEKLIERLRNAAGGPEGIKMCQDAATALSTLQAENTELRAELTHKTELVYRQANELERRDKLLKEQEAELDRQMQYTNHYQQLTDTGLEVSNSLLVELEKVKEELKQTRNELEQVKHQLDSYRLYHDDLASRPNCNTCADKDCKYRPIPGDTVRANCPLWRGPEEEG